MLDFGHQQYSQVNAAPPPSLLSLDPLTPSPYMTVPPQNNYHSGVFQDASLANRTAIPPPPPPQNDYDQSHYNTASSIPVYNTSPYPVYSVGPTPIPTGGPIYELGLQQPQPPPPHPHPHPHPLQQQHPLQQPAPPPPFKPLNQGQLHRQQPTTSLSLILSSSDSQFAYNRNGLMAYSVGSPGVPPTELDHQMNIPGQSPMNFTTGIQNSSANPPFLLQQQHSSGFPAGGQFINSGPYAANPGIPVYGQPFKTEEFGYQGPLFEENHFPRHLLDLLTSFDYFSSSQKQMNLPGISEPLVNSSYPSFNSLTHLHKHQNRHLNSYDISIMDHLKEKPALWAQVTSPTSENSYKCAHCANEFHSLLAFVQHLDQLKVRRTHLCPVDTCPFSIIGLQRKAELRRHCILEHFKRGRIKENTEIISPESELQMARLLYLCQEQHCGKHFYRKDSLQRHQKLVHSNKESKFNRKWNKLRRDSDNNSDFGQGYN